MIKSLITVALVALSISAFGQTNTAPAAPVATNGIADTTFWTDAMNWASQGSNFIVVPYGIVTTGNNGKYGAGGGVALAYAVSQYLESGMRMEYLNKAFYQASFSGQIQVPITLFNKVTIVPFVLGGVAVPFGGGASSPGTVQGIAGTGLAVRLSSKVDLIGDVEKWSATPGQQFRFGIGYKF